MILKSVLLMREGLMPGELVEGTGSATKGVQANKWGVLQGYVLQQQEKRE